MSGYDFIFSDKKRHRIVRHIVFWTSWMLFFTLIYGSRPNISPTTMQFYYLQSYGLSFLESIIFLPDHLVFSYLLMYFLLPRYFLKGKYLHLLLGTVVLIFLMQSTTHTVTNMIASSMRTYLGLPAPSVTFYFSLLAGLRGGLTVGGFATAIKLMKYWYQKNRDNQWLIQQNLQAELQLLKSQIHPHFLFNTLNNLYALTLTSSPKSPEVVLKLSSLLTYMLYECNPTNVLLNKEVDLLRDYITLEKLRYEERLDISVSISGDIQGKLIAPLLLLPFLENSFKHGVSEQLDQAWISLDLSVRGNTMKFKLINSKPPSESPKEHPEGIGLQNVRKRLQLIYPDQHELLVLNEEETFMVVLTLQLETLPAGEPPPAQRPSQFVEVTSEPPIPSVL